MFRFLTFIWVVRQQPEQGHPDLLLLAHVHQLLRGTRDVPKETESLQRVLAPMLVGGKRSEKRPTLMYKDPIEMKRLAEVKYSG